MTRLYISGPVTGLPDRNSAEFERAMERLRDAGYTAHFPHGYVPEGEPWPTAMLASINALTEHYGGVRPPYGDSPIRPYFDGVALLPGWEQSEGAKLEVAVAEACGIPVKTVDEWLEDARNDNQ